MKIKKGDKVRVLAGKDKGREGQVEKTFPGKNKVLVAGINLFKKHTKPQSRKDQAAGGIIDIIKPLPAANVAIVCPKCGKPTRIGWQIFTDEKKRICRKCKEVI